MDIFLLEEKTVYAPYGVNKWEKIDSTGPIDLVFAQYAGNRTIMLQWEDSTVGSGGTLVISNSKPLPLFMPDVQC